MTSGHIAISSNNYRAPTLSRSTVQPKDCAPAQNVPFGTTLAMCGALIAEADLRSTWVGSYSASAGGFAVVGLYSQGGTGHRDGEGLPRVGAAGRGLVPAGHDDAGSAGRPPSLPGARRSGDRDGQRRQGARLTGRLEGGGTARSAQIPVSAWLAGPLESGSRRRDRPGTANHGERHEESQPSPARPSR